MGSGAGGVMAVRYNHRRDEWVAYTTMRWAGDHACNEKRICRLTNRKEIAVLAEEVMRCGAVLEEWMVKEKLEGENYDLRVVCREDEVDYVVVRCSKGAITNLHLNNKARLFGELSLAPSVREELFCRSIAATRALGLRVCRHRCADCTEHGYTLYYRGERTGRSYLSGYVYGE